jgi:hypothetical protein
MAAANPDRKNAIAGMSNMTLGSAGSAAGLLRRLVDSLNSTTYKVGNPETWADMFGELKKFETAVPASQQTDDWMASKRAQWQKFCDNVDSQHPAGFATAALALEVSIKAASQKSSWMSHDRAGWVSTCNAAGAKPFGWGQAGFVCSGLDGCEVLLEDVVRSVPAAHMSSGFVAGDYKTYGALFDAVKGFEAKIKGASQKPDWMSGKRATWLTFCNNTANHTPAGFATAVMALDASVPAANNSAGWMGAQRDTWMNRCRSAGGKPFTW